MKNRNRLIFLTDLLLFPAFILTLWSGLALHAAGHDAGYEPWHRWAVCHTIAALLFAGLAGLHVHSHRGWYKGVKAAGCKGRKKIVLALTLFFAATVVSGTALLFVDGLGSHIGHLHYRLGLAAALLAIGHVLKRRRILYKGVATHVFGRKNNRTLPD